MQKIAWITLRQLEALRESVATTLMGGAIDRGMGKSDEFKATWLASQGVKPTYLHYVDEDRYILDMQRTMEKTIADHGVNVLRVQLAGTRSRYNEEDVGFERGSTGWDRLPNFITSSALIRLLGALEQYEIDVLKALLYYRPSGKEYVGKTRTLVDVAVVTEQPDETGKFTKPALWSWLKKPAENAVERRMLFSKVFDITCTPPVFGSRKPKEINAYYQSLYSKRNAIAHGRESVDVSLAEFCEAEAFVLSMVMHMSLVCEEKYNLGI